VFQGAMCFSTQDTPVHGLHHPIPLDVPPGEKTLVLLSKPGNAEPRKIMIRDGLVFRAPQPRFPAHA